MKEILNELIDHRSLTKDSAKKVLVDLASGKYNPSLTTAFMTVYMMRSITVDELQGFRDAMLELCVPARFDQPVMDVCGTGGDGKNTFNMSTLSSFVVAAAGQPVAKHGNYGVSSACGSSNLLEYFGYTFTNDIGTLKRSLDRANICFMHAPLFHPAMKNVAPIRKELGVKTFFNMLGPMVNPSFPTRQLVGVFSLELARQYGYLYQNTEKDFLILHSLDGYDEVSLTGAFKFFHNGGEKVLEPTDLGLPQLKHDDIRGGNTVEESAKVFMNVLEGKGTPAQEAAVIANASMALFTGHQNEGLPRAVERATEALRSGKALQAFKKLMEK
ncbi:anthranilate phosphoribosyltransferase [Chryseolinea lacunae]|uniref:Anthranilate phosphoribosyltransferase n=1 Tax=Chryseolinea lacunae TaxID=2801331 RepID=A0ABS1KW96_9BACT|nr:anthranilate phosphoribosyltransferase [Chryseolinea lacunae]MBL0743502.1 anthranilate phosphoribosyltransferase [Chryseolinea lacunae]